MSNRLYLTLLNEILLARCGILISLMYLSTTSTTHNKIKITRVHYNLQQITSTSCENVWDFVVAGLFDRCSVVAHRHQGVPMLIHAVFSKKILIKLLIQIAFSSHKWSLQDIKESNWRPSRCYHIYWLFAISSKAHYSNSSGNIITSKYSRQHNFRFDTW